jgi:Fe-S-cluster containining protein
MMSRKSKPWRSAVAALHKVWENLPRMHCKGLCTESCGPIFMTDLEEQILKERVGTPLPVFGTEENPLECPLLVDRRCSVYNDRPTICRLWGMVHHELMICPFGCQPERRLTNKEAKEIFEKVGNISKRYLEEQFQQGEPQ